MHALILQDLSLHTADGRCLLAAQNRPLPCDRAALVGANGAGKSRLLRVLAGLDPPTTGQVICGLPIQRLDADPFAPVAAPRAELSLAISPARRRLLQALWPDSAAASPAANASPGRRRRWQLWQLLRQPQGLLLLDEPSVHLDPSGQDALRDWLGLGEQPYLLVSHDPELLQAVAQVHELSAGQLHSYALDFAAFRQQRRHERTQQAVALTAARTQLQREQAAEQAARERAEQSAAQGRRLRRRGSQGKLLLDYRQDRAESGAGRRQRLSHRRQAQAGQQLQAERQRLLLETDICLGWAQPLPSNERVLLSVQGLTLCAGSRTLLEGLDWSLRNGQRLALCGANDSGKSWLLQVLAGSAKATAGTVQRHVQAVRCIGQQALPATASGGLWQYACASRSDLGEAALRRGLAQFLFPAARLDTPLSALSSGERWRLALLLALAGERPPELLLLDEPDQHLDLPSRAVIQSALRHYPGTLLVVSHGPAFLAEIGCQQVLRLGPTLPRGWRLETPPG